MLRTLLALLLLIALPAWAQTTVIYSRADTAQAQRAYRLARLYEPVLIDVHLLPGVPWRAVIAHGICSSRVVLLLWSRRAAASTEVAREIQLAQSCAVPVVPVLLDTTPLPADVGQRQAIDWR
jgi:hypothetical protein